MKSSFSLMVLCSMLVGPALAAADSKWIATYAHRTTNEAMWDERAKPLVEKVVPGNFSEQLREALAGPPDLVLLFGNRYATLSACKPKDCPLRGFMWVDMEKSQGVGAIFNPLKGEPDDLIVMSSTFAPEALPKEALYSLISWQLKLDGYVKRVDYFGPNGCKWHIELSALKLGLLKPSGPAEGCAH